VDDEGGFFVFCGSEAGLGFFFEVMFVLGGLLLELNFIDLVSQRANERRISLIIELEFGKEVQKSQFQENLVGVSRVQNLLKSDVLEVLKGK